MKFWSNSISMQKAFIFFLCSVLSLSFSYSQENPSDADAFFIKEIYNKALTEGKML